MQGTWALRYLNVNILYFTSTVSNTCGTACCCRLLCSGIPKQQDSEEFQSAALTSLSDALMNVPVEGHPALLRNNPVDELFGVELTTTYVPAVLVLLLLSCCTAGYLSLGAMAQCVVHALKGLACGAHVTPAGSALTSPSLQLCLSFSRTLRSQKT